MDVIQYNRLGQSDLNISQLTLGCMSLGNDINRARKIVHLAMEAGINHLDTADLYDFGENERLLGKIIKDHRQELIITSKVGNEFDPETKEINWNPTYAHIINSVKQSLKRLNTDYLDLYLLHGGTIDDNIDESIAAFEFLKKDGLIRAYGISSIRPNVIHEYVNKSNMDAVMMQYSLLDRRPEEEILNVLATHHISVLARGPFAKGILTNRFHEQIEKKAQKGYLQYDFDELQEILEQIDDLKENQSINELAIQYVLRNPTVASAVFGASSTNQVQENTQLNLDQVLSEEIYKKLKSITKEYHYSAHRH